MIQEIRTPRPATYDVSKKVQCDGCGLQVAGRSLIGDTPISPLGWFTGSVETANETGGIEKEERVDYCPDCYPTIQEAQHQAAKAIIAAKVAVAAEASGVS